VAFVDAVDSHYQHVKARIKAENPTRQVLGLLEAQDWPPKTIKTQAFYLLTLKNESQEQGTKANAIRVHFLQWVWIIEGTDLQQGVRAANRGDRFRINEQMKGELAAAMFPRFTVKQSWQLNANGVWVGTPKDPPEVTRWSKLQLMQRTDRASGLVYGIGSVNVTDMMRQILA
jgi:hypothetical protein